MHNAMVNWKMKSFGLVWGARPPSGVAARALAGSAETECILTPEHFSSNKMCWTRASGTAPEGVSTESLCTLNPGAGRAPHLIGYFFDGAFLS
jgi:hypothetical protein